MRSVTMSAIRSRPVSKASMFRAAATGVVAAIAICAVPASAQQPLPPGFLPVQLENYSAEFPPLGPSYSLMRPGLLADYMARQLREMPDALETLETVLLMEEAGALSGSAMRT